MCTTVMRVRFAFHSYIHAAENIEAKEKEQKGNQKAFEYYPPHRIWQSARGAVSHTSFPPAFGNFYAPFVFPLMLLQSDDFKNWLCCCV